MRSTLLTGLDPIRTGVLGNATYLRPDLDACGIRTWPALLSDAGYKTCAIGKMHFYPWEAMMGFQERIICEDKRWIHIDDDYQNYLRSKGLRKLHGNEHDGYQENRGAIVHRHSFEDSWDGFVGNSTVDWLRRCPVDRPFALMVGFPGPHCPYDPSPEYAHLFRPEDMPDPHPEAPGQPPHFREGNIRGNLGTWNGVDYTVFSTEHKKKIRAHYAALVKQIDDLVGRILTALEETGRLEDTVIVFSSDHGDYLGDHGLIGKGTWYESSIKVPLLVRIPSSAGAVVAREPTSIEDITATLLALAGCEVPSYMDSRPLPHVGLPGAAPRDHVFGVLAPGCMAYDGTWKLAKYATGDALLFNVREDPGEQRNRIDDPACRDVARRLDAVLTADLLRSVNRSNAEKAHHTDWEDPAFARGGGAWKRIYPGRVL
jgi:arylsulfatase A-like enzyme